MLLRESKGNYYYSAGEEKAFLAKAQRTQREDPKEESGEPAGELPVHRGAIEQIPVVHTVADPLWAFGKARDREGSSCWPKALFTGTIPSPVAAIA